MSNNIDISGSGKVTGGDYNNINISNSSNKDFIRLNLFYLPSDYSFIKNNSYLSTDFVKSVCIDSINLFFDYSLMNHDISFEQYEIFYEWVYFILFFSIMV